ncbi:asparagine synthase-related protein [Bradyrhizobium sp. LA6.7]|uniref:asparagine synthase-related protein n=1 Tax=unclassified Bradyrhizobium TaxID=2631580 RepID=UPI0033970668
MCGFVGKAFEVSSKYEIASSLTAYRGSVSGGWSDPEIELFAWRLPRSGNRIRPQPVVTDSGSVLALNGEIYNAPQLVRRLGLSVRPGTVDTEILALWLDSRGAEGVSEVEGEFALAFFDKRRHALILSRDVMGTKPLFWRRVGEAVSFGSSARATSLLAAGAIDIDAKKVSDCLWYGIPETGSCFSGVESVGPGTTLVFTSDATKRLTRPLEPSSPLIAEMLSRAVQRRAAGSGNGLAWSGGLDSGLLKEFWPESVPCTTAHISAHKSDVTADVVGLTSAEGLQVALTQFADIAERPLTSLSGPALSILAKAAASRGVKIWLSGEGADEIFAGYSYYFAASDGHPFLTAKHQARRVVEQALGLPSGSGASDQIVGLMQSDSPKSWLEFDRTIRLPEHLCAVNSDLPSMLAGIEPRTPYLDLWSACAADRPESPKKPLQDIARSRAASFKPKEGIFFPTKLLGQEWILQAAREIEGAEFIQIPPDLSVRVASAFDRFHKLSLPEGVSAYLEEAICAFVVGVWSFQRTLRIPNPSKLQFEKTLVTTKDGWVCPGAGSLTGVRE